MMRYFWVLLLFVLLLSEYKSKAHKSESKDGKEAEEGDDIAQNYLYLPLGDEAEPVIEFRPNEGEDPDEPEFIFGPDNGPRVVEFYAPWCPHCQHFRDHYVDFGETLQKLAKQQPGNEEVDIKIYAVSCSVYRNLCKAFGVESYPGIRLFKAGAVNATETKYFELHPFDVLKDLGLQTAELNLELPSSTKKRRDKSQPDSLADMVNVRTKQNVFDDAWLSLDFALKNGVFTNSAGSLSNTTQTHLKDWLDLLHAALPPSWQIHKLIQALRDKFDDIIHSETKLSSILELYPPPRKKWSSSCTHGDPVAGYTCGLWELFHLVTIGVVEYNLMISTDDGELVIHTEDAATTIRNFVDSFFGCEVCRTNFVSSFDRCSFNRCTRLSHASYKDTEWVQLPVWLWEVHNSVRTRLLHEKAKRENWEPKHQDDVDTQWPSRDSCPKCWDAQGAWDDETMYKFLRLEYWPEDELSETYRAELLLSEILVDKEDAASRAIGFSPLILSFLFFGVGGSAGFYARRQKRWLSGRHKKTDESFANNGYNHFTAGV